MKKMKINSLVGLLLTFFNIFSLFSVSAFATDSSNGLTTHERIINGVLGGIYGLAIGGAAVTVFGLLCIIIFKSKPIPKTKTKGLYVFLLGIIVLAISAILYFLIICQVQ